ncbi:MAG: hypothetical protein ACLR4A_12840 [Christensenellales bacterium]
MPSKRDAMTARALALVGCGYIYGATGWICTRARMEQQMRQYPTYAGQIERYGKSGSASPATTAHSSRGTLPGAPGSGCPAARQANGGQRAFGRKKM